MKNTIVKFLMIMILGANLMAQPYIKQSLNGTWKFIYDRTNKGLEKKYYSPEYSKEKWQELFVPSFWYEAEYDGIGWYALDFIPDDSLSKKKLALVFDAVDDEAEVFLNGSAIHKHSGANVRFAVDVSENIYRNKTNHLVVKINDTGGPGGLCGDLYLRSFERQEDLQKSDYFSRESTPLPKWMENRLIYELYVRAHSNEGTFNAVTRDLPRLKDLGVGCVWFMPIFPVGQIEKKGSLGCPYAIADFKQVNPEYGTMADFKKLVKTAHEMDIKIILDIACNHSSWDNWLIEKHPEYYSKNEKGQIIYPAGTDWTDVADFDYDNPDLREYMWSALEFWVKELNIDGYRCDVAELVPDDFWLKAYERLEKINPEVLMLAEGEHPRLHVNGFQMTYAWNLRIAVDRILKGEKHTRHLAEMMEKNHYRYPQNSTHMLFTENHDKRRTPDFFGEEKEFAAAVLIFSLPGIPMIYDGQEIGEAKTPSLFHKQTIQWNFDNKYNEFYKTYFALRQQQPAFSKGNFQPAKNSTPSEVLTYFRIYSDNKILIVANVTGRELTTDIQMKESVSEITLLMGNTARLRDSDHVSLQLGAYEYSIIKFK